MSPFLGHTSRVYDEGERRQLRALALAAIPVAAAIAFTVFAPSDGANIGGGMLTLVALALGAVIYRVAMRR